MKTTINAVKFKADPKLENFVTEKCAKLDRLIDNATKCEVFLKVDKPESDNNKIAEISITLPGQTLFNSKQAVQLGAFLCYKIFQFGIGFELNGIDGCFHRFSFLL